MPVPGQYKYSENELPQKTQKGESHKLRNGLSIILIAVIIFGAYSYWPQITNAYEMVKNSTGTAIKPITQILNPNETITQYQNIWGSASSAPEPNKFTLQFVNPANQTPFSVVAGLTVKADEDLTLKPQCFLDNQSIATDPAEIVLSKSDLEQSSSITCSNPTGGKQLSIKIENPSIVETVAQISLGSGKNSGKLTSKQNHGSAYSLSLSTLDSLPFNVTRSYPLKITIQKVRASATLEDIGSLKISTLSSNYHIECPFGNELSADRNTLAKYQNKNNQANDEYDMICQIVVTEIPGAMENSFLVADMGYTAQEEFKTTLA